MHSYEKTSRSLYMALFGCIICFVITLIIQSFSTYTLYNNALDFETRYLQETVDNTIAYIDRTREIIENEKEEAQRSFNKDEVRQKIEESLRQQFYATASSHSYMWINEVNNFDGGDGYGIRLIHPNLKSREGEPLSTKTKDAVGNTPYLTELEGVKKNGAILYSYYFKDLNADTHSRKLTYARLYPDYNWIICMGIPYNAVWGEVLFNKTSTLLILITGYLLSLAGIIYLLLQLRRIIKKELEGHLVEIETMQHQIEYDNLTKAHSRPYGISLLDRSLQDFNAYGTKNLVAIFDIDRFKSINDNYGHDYGDFVLQETTNTIMSHIRQEDFLIRWGGDEFIIIFFPIPKEDIELRLQQLNQCIREHIFKDSKGTRADVTISIGAGYFSHQDRSIQELLKRIDQALYKAKESRDTYRLADEKQN